MTPDALIAILLNVFIPSLLTLAGGILAIRSFRDVRSIERWVWISVFVFLFLVAVVLGFVQQVMLTSQQKKSDDKAAASELRSNGEIRYMQGQLDSINKVLTTTVSKSGDSGLAKDLLKALASQASDAAKPYSNSQLRDAALDLARRLREFQFRFATDEAKMYQTYFPQIAAANKNKDTEAADKIQGQLVSAEVALHNREQMEFGSLRAEAMNMRTQLLNRLPPQPDNMMVQLVLDRGVLAGASPIYEVASYIEQLARLLPER